MDEMKDKFKGFMKKVNLSSSPSGKFKGQGRVLGSSSSGPTNPIHTRPLQNANSSRPTPTPTVTNPRPSPKRTINPVPEQNKKEGFSKPNSDRKPENGFDPYDSLITTGKRSQHGYSLDVYKCPICGQNFRSEKEVSIHVDTCVSNPVEHDDGNGVSESPDNKVESRSELEICIGTYMSEKPSEGSVEVVLKLLKNIVKEPENVKFRKLRMSNPKIKEAVGDVAGGIELISFVGFELREENGETWAAMEVPTEEQMKLIKKAVALLEGQQVQEPHKREIIHLLEVLLW